MKDDPKNFDPSTERPKTIKLVGEDGRTHLYGWNPNTKAYDIDLGPVEKDPSPYPAEEP